MRNIESASHTRGESEYVDDMPHPTGMLYAAIFSSPAAKGKIKRLHTRAASSVNGVACVLTADDIPGENQIGPIIRDEQLLAETEVHFVGQPIAVVAAEDPDAARKASRKLEIEIDEQPPITDPKEAYRRGHVIGTPRTFNVGDVDAAWEDCHLVIDGSCNVGGQEHVYLETHRSRAVPLEGGIIRIYSSTQSPNSVQKTIARILGVQHHFVEVEVKRLGGGFGGKEDQATPWAAMTALAAWHTKRPVELVLRRTEDMVMTGKRHPYRSDFRIGVTKEGRILAFDVKHYQNSGAAADLSTSILERTLLHSTNSYFIPNVRIFGVCCRTNLPPNTAFRGFGAPQGMFVMESAITSAAEALGRPREEIQHLNLLKKRDGFPYGQNLQNDHVRKTWETAIDTYDIAKIREAVGIHNRSVLQSKKGYALMPVCFGISFTSIFMNQANALVHVYTDGSVSISTGGIEMGQGLNTNIVRIASTAFGIRPERIKIEPTNTTRTANMSPSAASATTLLNGNAVLLAAQQILERLKTCAVRHFNLPEDDNITIDDERVLVNGKDTGWSWQELVEHAYVSRTCLSAHAYFATPDIWFDREAERGEPFAYHVTGTAVIEVTLDCLRGTYDIDSVKIVHDLGTPLNKRIDKGQIEGGLAQGLGWMTLEDLQFNEKGEYLSNSLATYKLPDVYFMPDDIQMEYLEHAESHIGPFGSKAVGEPPLMYGIGVFFAIRMAMKAFKPDVDFDFTSPLSPERVLLQLYPDVLCDLTKDVKSL